MKKTPKNKCWIVSIGNDDFKYHPQLETISKVKKHNKKAPVSERFKMYGKIESVQKICDALNSM